VLSQFSVTYIKPGFQLTQHIQCPYMHLAYKLYANDAKKYHTKHVYNTGNVQSAQAQGKQHSLSVCHILA